MLRTKLNLCTVALLTKPLCCVAFIIGKLSSQLTKPPCSSDQLAAQSPQGARVRPGMTAAEAQRMLDRSAAQRQKGLTRPTFNEAVSWQCHQKLWRKHSKTFFANTRLWKQLLSRVLRGQKYKHCAEASTKVQILTHIVRGRCARVSRLCCCWGRAGQARPQSRRGLCDASLSSMLPDG